jgi:hypothetical protein
MWNRSSLWIPFFALASFSASFGRVRVMVLNAAGVRDWAVESAAGKNES